MAFQDVDDSGQIMTNGHAEGELNNDDHDDSYEELSHSLPAEAVDLIVTNDEEKPDRLDKLLADSVETDRDTMYHKESSPLVNLLDKKNNNEARI